MAVTKFASVTLAELGDLSNGVNFAKEAMGSGFGVINVTDIFHSGIKLDFSDLNKVELSSLKRIAHYGVQKHDLFFVRSSVKRDGVGLVSYSPTSSTDIVHCGFVIRFRIRDARANPIFVAYALRSPFYRETLKNLSSGTAIVNISQSSVGSLELALPPKNVQDRIASILSAYDELIENNTRRIKILEEMAQMIYREWFVNFRFPGHEKVRMVESEMGLIPEKWALKRLGEVANVNELSIKSSSAPERIRYIDIASVSTARIEKIDSLNFADAPGRARRIMRHGDIIWSTVRPNRRSYALILTPEPNLIVSTGFAVLTATTVPFSYLYLTVTTDDFADYLTNHATGSAYPAVTGKEFERASLIVPTAPLRSRFHEIAEPMLNLSWCLHQRNGNLRTTRDLLLPKLISGEIPVEAAEDVAAELVEQTT